MINNLKRPAVTALAAILIAACGDAHTTPQTPATNTFTRIQTEIFTPSCALSGCHDSGSHQAKLDLSIGNAYLQIFEVTSTESPLMRVVPSDPNNSYLFQKINGTAGIAGSRMPLGTAPLSNDQINLVRDWILSGAPNN